MVQITSIKSSQSKDDKTFFSFVVEGGIELVQSNQSGKFYAKGKRALLNTTLSEESAQMMVGTQLPGSIVRVACDPYEYTIKETSEVIILHHSYEYSANEESISITPKANVEIGDFAPVSEFE